MFKQFQEARITIQTHQQSCYQGNLRISKKITKWISGCTTLHKNCLTTTQFEAYILKSTMADCLAEVMV